MLFLRNHPASPPEQSGSRGPIRRNRRVRRLSGGGLRSKKWSTAVAAALVAAIGLPIFTPTVVAQTAPVGNGFALDVGDLRFIYDQILVAQDHAAGGTLLGPGPHQVSDPQLPRGLRTVDGSFNNLVPIPDQHLFGSADRVFPRMTVPNFRGAEPFQGGATSYAQKFGVVADSQPRVISNLIVDQSASNPAAVAAALNPCGSGGFVCSGPGAVDPDTGTLFIPNITPDFGLSAPFNLMFAFFGQFFDHGLDLVTKGGGTVIMPLQPDDPLFVPGADTNFMVLTRATNLPGPDGVLGTQDDIQEGINTTTPWVDQNQTYTSHPSHQVFLRQYKLVAGRPSPDGRMLDGGSCVPRGTGLPDDNICDIGNWNEVKAQAATKLGIKLADSDVLNVPLVLTDPYGHFKPGPARGMPQLVLPGNALLEGNPAGGGITIPANAFRTGHAFLNDIAHNADPSPQNGVNPTADTDAAISVFGPGQPPQPAGTYDDELLGRHFVTGDGRGNENIGLTAMHQIFHAEHNRLVARIDQQINTLLTAPEIAAWHGIHSGSGWGYEERLFQAARFVTEMEYQHLVFEEFARKMQPLINPFLGGITTINADIPAEFAHTVYRLGHSMLPEIVARINADGSNNDIRLLTAFLNPLAFNDGGPCTTGPACVGGRLQLTAPQAAGSLVRGFSRQVGNELDEFVSSSVRNTLVGLPLDLAAINLARGRSEGIPSLNSVRKQFFTATRDSAVAPYANWFEFGLSLKHRESLINFVAAYGTDPSITSATTVAAKRAAATPLVLANASFMFAPAAQSGLDNVDFWVGGLAEKQAVFGGLLGSTFNFVFEKTLENLQDGDRFYYLQRTDGLNLRFQLEGNSLAELAMRNTDAQGLMAISFDTADFNFDMGTLTGTAPVNLGNGMQILTLADGTKLFFDPLHTGKNIVFNGSAGNDRMQADIGDDTMYGNDGDDRMVGGEGNDTMVGGDGDDIMFGDNGDDILKGGPGNDAMNGGPGFGGDLLIGAEGNDFMVGGNDGVEYFAGVGNDVLIDGTTRSEGIFGGPGDDWLDGGDGHDGGLFGDNGNVFDLLAGLDPVGGDDVLDGGPGQDGHFGEGGDDIFLMSEGSNKFFGDFGFDWVTQRGWPVPGDIELDLFALPGIPLNFNDLRNFYRMVDGASGWDFDDHIRGDSRVSDPTAGEFFNLPGTELTATGAAKITGLTELFVNGFGQTFPYNAGNILLGGRGSDVFEGKGGDDLIDGDLWLDVQLRAVLNDGTVKLVNSARDLIDDVFADPQRLNPGNITIVKTIVTPVVPPPDCGAAAPLNCDTAVFAGPFGNYTVTNRTLNGSNIVTVTDVVGSAIVGLSEGTDTLRNIERLQFADRIIAAPGAGGGAANVAVPSVVGLSQAAAVAVLTGADFVSTSTNLNSTTVAIGNVISQNPAAGQLRPFGSNVALVISVGASVPNVVGATQTAATATLTGAGLLTGPVTTTGSTSPAGTVLSQAPPSGTNVAPGTSVSLVVSSGAGGPVLAASVSVNANAPNLVVQTAVTAVTPAANTLLVALISTDAPATGANTVVNNMTNTGTALTWTRAVRSNVQRGTAEIWWAFATSAHASMRVTAVLNNSEPASLTVMSFTNAAPSLVGAASLAANAATGAPAAALVTTRDNSMVLGVGIDWDNPRVMVAGTGQTIVNQFRPTVGDTYWVQRTNAVGAAGTSVTINDSYGTTMPDRWNLALIEIRKQ
jgi:heme peroxidase/PASTA domain-containing protein/hemolysin type calcium-binding protein